MFLFYYYHMFNMYFLFNKRRDVSHPLTMFLQPRIRRTDCVNRFACLLKIFGLEFPNFINIQNA